MCGLGVVNGSRDLRARSIKPLPEKLVLDQTYSRRTCLDLVAQAVKPYGLTVSTRQAGKSDACLSGLITFYYVSHQTFLQVAQLLKP